MKTVAVGKKCDEEEYFLNSSWTNHPLKMTTLIEWAIATGVQSEK